MTNRFFNQLTFGKCAKTFQYRKITFLQILKIRHLQAQNEHEPYILLEEKKELRS